MAAKHNQSSINAYARSLLELANERNQTDAVAQELTDVREVIRANPTFAAFLADPGIGVAERAGVLQRTLGGKLSPLVMNFLGVLNARRRAAMLAEIADAYHELLAEQRGIVEVDVTVAQRLSPEELEQVRQRVGQALGKQAVVHQYVDESIIGGLVLRVEDRLIDASARYQLQSLRQRMLTARRK